MASILLVDDDTVFLHTLQRSLQRRDQTVHSAENSQQAMQVLSEQQVDLVLLDLNLGTESGIQLLTQILQHYPKQTVVMLTAYASIATAVDAVKKGAENYLCKPITARDVLGLLEQAEEPTIETESTPLSPDRLEWEHIQRVLMENEGNISATARALNMHRRTLQRKLQKRPVNR